MTNSTVQKKSPLHRAARKILNSRLAAYLRTAHGDLRYLFLPLCWWIAEILVPRRRVTLGNATFTLQCDNEITHYRWYLFKSKEPETITFIDAHLTPGDLFLDIGANIGVFSLYAAARHPGVEIVAMEPEYSNLHYLKENIIANGMQNAITVYALAVSDRNGLSTLHVQDVMPGAALHSESIDSMAKTAEGRGVAWREGIATVSLDSLCRHLGRVPNAIKVDTDGNEARILSGGQAALSDDALRAIAIEMPTDSADNDSCRRMLETAGFVKDRSAPGASNEIWVRLDPATKRDA